MSLSAATLFNSSVNASVNLNDGEVSIKSANGKPIEGIYEDAMGEDYVITEVDAGTGLTLWHWDKVETAEADEDHVGGTSKTCTETGESKFVPDANGPIKVGTSPDKYPDGSYIGDLAKKFRTLNDLSDKQLEVIIEDPLNLYDGVMIDVKTIDTGLSTNYDDVNSIERSYNVNVDFYELTKAIPHKSELSKELENDIIKT